MGGVGGWRAFKTNNTKPTVNMPSVNIPTVNIPTGKNTDSKRTDTKNTEKYYAGNTNSRQKRHPPWHAIRASAVADREKERERERERERKIHELSLIA